MAFDSEPLRVEQAIFGHPGDLGFDLVSTSMRLPEADHRRLAGLCERGAGVLLQERAVSVVPLTRHVALVVSHPDRAPGKRAGGVVSQAFLIETHDYERIGCDPLIVLDQVERWCGDRLPNEAASQRKIQLRGMDLVERVRPLRLSREGARRLAPAVAARLSGSPTRHVVESADEPLECAALVLALSTRAGRRGFSFATSAFSREARTLDLVVARDVGALPSAPASPPLAREALEEAEHLLRIEPGEAAERVAAIERLWPAGTGPEAWNWLRTLRFGDEAIERGDWRAMLDIAVRVLGGGRDERAATRLASALCVRACTAGGEHRPEVLAELPAFLRAFQAKGILAAILAEIAGELERASPEHRLCLTACVERFCTEHGVANPFHESAEQLLERVAGAPDVDATAVERIRWMLEYAPPRSAAVLDAVEHFAWRHDSSALRRAVVYVAPRREALPHGVYRTSRFELLRSAVVGGERAVREWFADYRQLVDPPDAIGCLEMLLVGAEAGPARRLAIDCLLGRLGRTSAALLSERLPSWLQLGNRDGAIGVVVQHFAKAVDGPRDEADRLDLLRLLHEPELRLDAELRHALTRASLSQWPAARARVAEAYRQPRREAPWQSRREAAFEGRPPSSEPFRGREAEFGTDAQPSPGPAEGVEAEPPAPRPSRLRALWRRLGGGAMLLAAVLGAGVGASFLLSVVSRCLR